jgi:hypothetical protein
VQAGVFEGKPRGRPRCVHELRLLEQRGVVNEDGQRLAFVLEPGDRPAAAIRGQHSVSASCIDEAASFREPVEHLEGRIFQRSGKRVTNAVRRRLLELEHEVADTRTCQTRTQESHEQCNGQSDERSDLPPEQVVVENRRGARDEGEHALEHGSKSHGDGGQKQRREHATGAGCRHDELPNQQDDRCCGEDAPNDDDEELLQHDGCTAVPSHEDEAVARCRVEKPKRSTPVVDEQDRDGEEECHPVADLDQRLLGSVGDAAGWI